MPSLTVENYLKTILLLEPPPGGSAQPVLTGKIASALGVAPGTVTSMLKTLDAAGLVQYRRYEGAHLTAEGRAAALNVLRRHRIVEVFLVKVLGMSWTEVHEEAEALEHAISDRVLDRLDAFLGHPTADPHGDPIPLATGRLPRPRLTPLADSSAGDRCIVARLLDQSPPFLKMAEAHDLMPGSAIQVIQRDATSEILRMRVNGKEVAVSTSVAARIAVSGPDPRKSAGQGAAAGPADGGAAADPEKARPDAKRRERKKRGPAASRQGKSS